MASTDTDYQPISCDYYDILELIATERRTVPVRYKGEDGQAQEQRAQILDLYSRDHVEYVSLSSGDTVRLDRLIEVDDKPLSDYGGKKRPSAPGTQAG
jgi:Rho-binding antiterminator